MFEGFRQDMTIKRVDAIPPELVEQLSNTGKYDYRRWSGLVPAVLHFSQDAWYVQYQGKPLLFIGTVQLCFLNPAREVFMFGSKHLRWPMLPTLRDMFNEWLAMETGPIYARAEDKYRVDYLKFFGFRLHEIGPDGIAIYKVL